MYKHACEMNVKVVVRPHSARKDLHPHAVALVHPDHGGLGESVVLKVVRVIAAGDDDAVVSYEQKAVVALHGVAVEREEIGPLSRRSENPAGGIQSVPSIYVANGVS